MSPLHIFYSLLVAVLWGGNFVAAKLALGHFPPFFFTALRFTFTALLLIAFVPRPPKSEIKLIGKISVLNTLHFSLPFVALAMGLSIASTAITAQLGVPFSCLLGAIFLHDKLGIWRTTGLAVAFSGMFVVFGAPDIGNHQLAFFLTLTGAFIWGAANIMMKYVKGVSPLSMMAWMSLFSTPQLYLIALWLEPNALESLKNIPLEAALGLAYTVIGSTIVAHGLWYYLLTTHPVTHVAPYSLLVPILGTLFGMIFFNEAITWHIIFGGIVTLVGIGIIVLRRPRLATLGEPEPV